MRASTLSMPTTSTKGGSSIIDALSTAVASIFISPGILTIDIKDAIQVKNNIESLQSFQIFKAFLQENLLYKCLNEIVLEPAYNSLLTSCLDEYFKLYSPIITRIFTDNLKWKNDLYYETSSDYSKITFHNRALRCVHVIHNLRTENVLDEKPKIISMKGAPPFSGGSIITLSYLLTHKTETFDYSPATGTVDSEFWVVGPGYKETTIPVPEL